MEIANAFAAWNEEIRPAVVAQYSADDRPALAESWNNYTDMLNKDGEFTDLQAHHCPAFDEDMPEDDEDERELILKGMGLRLEWIEYPKRPDNLSDWAEGSRHFKFSILRGTGGSISGWYSQGPAVRLVPCLEEVLYCLLSDTSGLGGVTLFEEWAEYMGIDTDSRKAEKVFNACTQTMRDLERIFGVQEIEDLRELFQDY